MKYRPEIDGLRTVAVLPVLLFHAGFSLFEGGFVGVDVFFVISGYLITGILIEDYYQGRHSIITFYERRARRILPALFVVMFFTIPFSWAWMLPYQFKDFSQSIVSVVLFASNFLFLQEEGYFAAAAEYKPMLHTWSLAVEEQFYLIFPILLAVLLRYGLRPTLLIISGITLMSFALSDWGVHHWPSAAFYLAPTRFWELLAGSLCAFALRFSNLREHGFLAGLGLALIGGAVLLFDKSLPFPGRYGIVPVLGTVLIILYAGSGTIVGILLSTRPLVGIGLISYSTYLWHQPLFALSRVRILHEPTPWLMLLLIALSMGLAYLSWRFVEQPIRRRQFRFLDTSGKVFVSSLAIGGMFLVFGLSGHITGGWAELRSRNVDLVAIQDRLDPNRGLSAKCEGAFTEVEQCSTSHTPEVLLWGDSFAMHLAQGLLASEEGVALRQHTTSVCSPILGLAPVGSGNTQKWARSCMDFNEKVMDWLRKNDSVKYVILSSPMKVIDGRFLLRDGSVHPAGDYLDFVLRELIHTVETIRNTGAKVVFVSPTPRASYHVGVCTAKIKIFGYSEKACDFTLDEIGNSRQFVLMDRMEPHVPVIRLDAVMCPDGICDAIRNGVTIWRDRGHLSSEGSEIIGELSGLMREVRRISR